MSLLTASGITKTYRSSGSVFYALDDVGLRIEAGERVGLIGESGSGKSTMASLLLGLEPADSGQIVFDGVQVDASVRPSRRTPQQQACTKGMQMVFQHPASSFPDRMRVGRAVAEGLVYRQDVGKAELQRRVSDALAAAGLDESFAARRAFELSGGQCQRVAIARAIISQPKLLICDEPTSALDVTVQAQVINLLANLCDEMGMACLLITHDLALARGFCDRIVCLEKGRVVEEGPSDEVFEHPRSDAVKSLLSAVLTI